MSEVERALCSRCGNLGTKLSTGAVVRLITDYGDNLSIAEPTCDSEDG